MPHITQKSGSSPHIPEKAALFLCSADLPLHALDGGVGAEHHDGITGEEAVLARGRDALLPSADEQNVEMIAVSQVHLHELFGGLLTAVDERCDTRFLRHAEELRDAVIEKPPTEVVDSELSRIEHLVRLQTGIQTICQKQV